MSVTETVAGKKLEIFITVIVAFCAVVGAWACLQDKICRQLVGLWATGKADQFPGLVELRGYDRNFLNASAGGNLALRFVNFDPNNRDQVIVVQEMFCRGAYALYPRRVWAVPEWTVLNGGRDALNAHFSPTQQWLVEHDVRAVIEMRADESGARSIRVVPVSPGGVP
jgi:hypothetical protein